MKSLFRPLALFVFLLFISGQTASAQKFTCANGHASFKSNAPLEVIQASVNDIRAALTIGRDFAFSVRIASFAGFNSELQRQHFNDQYMQSATYPTATFKGKIIEEIDLSKSGTYQVRAKGQLTIHGVTKEKIIKSTVVVSGDKVTITASFDVPLVEHNIEIPKVVFQKIAEIMQVTVNCTLIKQAS